MENKMRRMVGGKTRRRRGTAIVEFTLVFMLFFVVLLTMIEMARGFWTYATIATATRQLGTYTQVHGTLDRPVEAKPWRL